MEVKTFGVLDDGILALGDEKEVWKKIRGHLNFEIKNCDGVMSEFIGLTGTCTVRGLR